MRKLLAAAAAFTMAPSLAWAADPPSAAGQALSACLTRSTSPEDHVALIRWIFVVMARHPSVAHLAAIPDTQRVTINRNMGALVNRLLLESCREETRAAFQADGQHALGVPFATLGEKAMTGIMEHADVNAAVVEMTSYLDQARLAALVGAAPATQ